MLYLQFYLSLLCDPSKEYECKFAVIACPNQCDFYYFPLTLFPLSYLSIPCPFSSFSPIESVLWGDTNVPQLHFPASPVDTNSQLDVRKKLCGFQESSLKGADSAARYIISLIDSSFSYAWNADVMARGQLPFWDNEVTSKMEATCCDEWPCRTRARVWGSNSKNQGGLGGGDIAIAFPCFLTGTSQLG